MSERRSNEFVDSKARSGYAINNGRTRLSPNCASAACVLSQLCIELRCQHIAGLCSLSLKSSLSCCPGPTGYLRHIIHIADVLLPVPMR